MAEYFRCGHRKIQRTKGFSILESLFSLALFLFVFTAGLEFFCAARTDYEAIKKGMEADCSAFAAVEQLRADILDAGRGLIRPIGLSLIKAVENAASLLIYIKEDDFRPAANINAGSYRIVLTETDDISPAREVVIHDLWKGERFRVAAVDDEGIVLDHPAGEAYSAEEAQVILVRVIDYFLDSSQAVLRRRINNGAAQPMAEEVSSFSWEIDFESGLIRVKINLNAKEEKEYAISVFPKNPASAFI